MPDYFTLDEFRSLPEMQSTQKYPDPRVEDAAATITEIIEREVGTSFIPRTVTEIHDGTDPDGIRLRSSWVRSITSATADGITVTDTLDAPYGILRRLSGSALVAWEPGYGNVSVTYVAGYSETPPADIKEAAMQGTRAYLLETSSGSREVDRTSSITNDLGGTTSFVLAGRDNPTGYPRVDAVIVGWRDRIRVPGVA